MNLYVIWAPTKWKGIGYIQSHTHVVNGLEHNLEKLSLENKEDTSLRENYPQEKDIEAKQDPQSLEKESTWKTMK